VPIFIPSEDAENSINLKRKKEEGRNILEKEKDEVPLWLIRKAPFAGLTRKGEGKGGESLRRKGKPRFCV